MQYLQALTHKIMAQNGGGEFVPAAVVGRNGTVWDDRTSDRPNGGPRQNSIFVSRAGGHSSFDAPKPLRIRGRSLHIGTAI